MSRRHKYGAIPTTVDGIRFASKAEAARYAELRMLEKAGAVTALTLQPSFDLRAAQNTGGRLVLVGRYVADFSYCDNRTGLYVVEDVKGVRTALYSWKKRHFEAQYGLSITEIGRPARRRGAGRRKRSQVAETSKPSTRRSKNPSGSGDSETTRP